MPNLGFLGGAVVKNLPANARDMSLSRLQEIVKDREAWVAAVHRVIAQLVKNLPAMQETWV